MIDRVTAGVAAAVAGGVREAGKAGPRGTADSGE